MTREGVTGVYFSDKEAVYVMALLAQAYQATRDAVIFSDQEPQRKRELAEIDAMLSKVGSHLLEPGQLWIDRLTRMVTQITALEPVNMPSGVRCYTLVKFKEPEAWRTCRGQWPIAGFLRNYEPYDKDIHGPAKNRPTTESARAAQVPQADKRRSQRNGKAGTSARRR